MAIWYTDNITGDDNTGDGTISTPYKTISKAASVAANDDTIRVAGSGWSAVSGTLTNSTFNTSTIQTSVDLTGELSTGTLISFKDPAFGDRKMIYRVLSITTSSISINTATGLTPGVAYEVEKLTTNHYESATASTIFENISGSAVSGLKIEGGWTSGFTAQDGITSMVYDVSTTSNSGTGFLIGINNTGIVFNKFAFASISTCVGGTGAPIIGFGDLWLIGGGSTAITTISIPLVNVAGYTTNFYFTKSNFGMSLGNLGGTGTEFNINDIYILDLPNGTLNGNYDSQVTVENVYARSISTGTSTNSGLFKNGNWVINNCTFATSEGSGNVPSVFGLDAIGILKNVTFIDSSGESEFLISCTANNNVQFINTSVNTDTLTGLGLTSSLVATLQRYYIPVVDSEGEKLLFGGTISTFADSTEFDTGTNSLRIKKAGGNSIYGAVPIKQHYIPVGATSAITFTIRAKSTGSNVTVFGLQPPAQLALATTTTFIVLEQAFSLTNDWADYTYTLSAEDVQEFAGQYITLACNSRGTWTETYVWIDSVTIS